jgi:replication factor C small subunit
MEKIDKNEYLWIERYRPQTINDIIIPSSLRETFRKWVNEDEIPNLGFFGSPGLGKGSTYGALLKDMKNSYVEINGSKDNGIDILRTTITKFASSKSMENKVKVVVLDESDHLSPSAQAGLRNDIESFSKNARFILTGNYKDKIIPAVINRLQIYDLDRIFAENKPELGQQIISRLSFILKNENIEHEITDVAEVVKQFYPSTRAMINFLQQHSSSGKFILVKAETLTYKSIIEKVKTKDYKGTREAVKEITLPDTFFTWMWKNIDNLVIINSQPEIIPKMAEYQDMSIRAINKEIPLMAFLVTLMQSNTIQWV